MPVYVWEGRTRQGAIQRGEAEAASVTALQLDLRRRLIQPTVVRPKRAALRLPGLGVVPEKDVVVFTRQFATMIEAGLPLVQCLSILAAQQEHKEFKRVINDIREHVEGGATFSESLGRHPKVFDQLYVNLVAAGEVAGILDTILQRLANYKEKNMKLKNQVKGAMVYPISIIAIAVGVVSVLLIFVIPVFAKMFQDFGKALPLPTVIVIALSEWLKSNIIFIVGALGVLAFVARFVLRTQGGRWAFDTAILKVPVIGTLIRKIAVARFTRTLGTMVQSGVNIMDALDIVAKTAGNKVIEAALYRVRAAIAEGKTLAGPLAATGVFPPMVVQMIEVGEATGNLDAMLSKIADFYDDEVDTGVKALTSLMEPALMVFLGVAIGGIVIAMYLPIFEIASVVGG